MFYRKNITGIEQILRIAAGIAMVVAFFLGVVAAPWSYLLLAGGAIAALTGVVGFCPACAMVGRRLQEK